LKGEGVSIPTSREGRNASQSFLTCLKEGGKEKQGIFLITLPKNYEMHREEEKEGGRIFILHCSRKGIKL